MYERIYFTYYSRNDELAEQLRKSLVRLRKSGVRYSVRPFYCNIYKGELLRDNYDGAVASIRVTPEASEEALQEAVKILEEACASPCVMKYE